MNQNGDNWEIKYYERKKCSYAFQKPITSLLLFVGASIPTIFETRVSTSQQEPLGGCSVIPVCCKM